MTRTRSFIVLLAAVALQITPARAEVEKFMIFAQGHMKPDFRLKFEPPAGWQKEADASAKHGVAIYVPAGTNFNTAPTAMYVKVSYNSDGRSIDQFVQTSQSQWRAAVPDASITRGGDEVRSSNGLAYQVFRFQNPSRPQQAHELMAYGTDKDQDGNTFFVMVALTSPSEKALSAATPTYRQALRSN